MATWSDTYLEDIDSGSSKVGGGNKIYLNCTGVTYQVGVMTNAPPKPGKSINQAHNNLLSYGDNVGFKNPTMKVKGTIDLKSYDSTTGAGPTTGTDYIITQKLLMQIYKSGHVFKLTDIYDSSTTTPIYRLHSLTGTFPNETVTTVNVMCTGLTYEADAPPGGAREGEKIMYELEFTEVRS